MSSSAIQCRECHHTLAKRHHTGRIRFEVGIQVVMLPDGRIEAECPCGSKRVVSPRYEAKAA